MFTAKTQSDTITNAPSGVSRVLADSFTLDGAPLLRNPPMTAQERRAEALTRAVTGQTFSNYPAIIAGFAAKGIPESEIRPRENIFTYEAWKALGRHVRKGEHGVKVVTFVPMEVKGRTAGTEAPTDSPEAPRAKIVTRPWTTTVFHVSQTDADEPRTAA